ncbi:response regulator transcription factor [Sphingomonas morindae]|uniref:Response regulator transcription factor n=1 Tax=Sphingomonas morindae TaxID=1541170 RepID=A0ABY4X7D7_9SPHN|nr:response regulator transcription factor [Sphingomonas morindae]USI72530.1 response regulator transcription factor [Sphingomonas morindae]
MRALIVEDDDATALFISAGLESLGYQCSRSRGGDDALRAMTDGRHDVAILDRMLAGMDGLTILRAARAGGVTMPVLVLTALGQIADRVDGLEAGADDYLVKPFAMAELTARLTAITRRRSTGQAVTALTSGPLAIDLLHREVRHAGRLIALQPREIRLLEELMRNPGKIVTRSMMLERVWGFHFDPQTNLVETHMSRLRTKLALGGAKDVIETVRGAGYRLRTTSAV